MGKPGFGRAFLHALHSMACIAIGSTHPFEA
jgi:hypothetical protein